jgi:hypothetical protein
MHFGRPIMKLEYFADTNSLSTRSILGVCG